ncbi:MAG: Ig-like domain-containing protein [Paludibacteraceae bacterium]|nr:Ig-like domain-containing protein [Paludibacteraceae bacterium]
MTSALLSAKPVTLLYIAGGTPIVKNNIFISEETSCVNSLVRGALNANCTNNVFYSAGGNGVIVDGATACANWSDLCTKYSAQARTSTWQQIELTDNYKPTSTYVDNVNLAVTPLAEVTTDIEGTARSETKTYAGCYEASNIAAVYSGVSSLTLPATASVERDNTIELTPTVTPAIAANRTQFWSSDNTAVATVDNSGVVTAVATGYAEITVTIDGVTSDPCIVTVYRTDFAVTWEPNGATTTSTAPASNNDLWTLFMPAYNTYYNDTRSPQAITAVATFANAKMQEFMTDPESPWKWLGDYMLSVATAQGYTLDTEQKWRFCAQAFFNCAEADVYAINAPDFTTAGQIANWLPLWKQTNNYLPPTMRATDAMPVISKDNDRLVGWYDNSEFEGEPVTSVTEDITLYALWDEPIELDEESSDNIGTIEANDGNLVNVVLRRPFTANGYWYTLVLPFDVTAEQLAETFGAGTEVTVLQSSYKKSETAIYLNFVKQTTIQAGVPCLFKPGRDIEEVAVFRDVTINNTTPQKSTALVNMVGLYAPDDVELNDNNYYLGNTNYLHEYVELYQNTKGFRAYFHFNETLSAGCAPRVMFHEDTTTELEDILEITSPIVEKAIRDGQLIIIRDGKEFNAQGQLIQ